MMGGLEIFIKNCNSHMYSHRILKNSVYVNTLNWERFKANHEGVTILLKSK